MFPLQRASRRKEQTGTQVPLLPTAGRTQAIHPLTLSSCFQKPLALPWNPTQPPCSTTLSSGPSKTEPTASHGNQSEVKGKLMADMVMNCTEFPGLSHF